MAGVQLAEPVSALHLGKTLSGWCSLFLPLLCGSPRACARVCQPWCSKAVQGGTAWQIVPHWDAAVESQDNVAAFSSPQPAKRNEISLFQILLITGLLTKH